MTHQTLASCLRRGLLAGLLGGLLAGFFALVIGEKPLEQAIRLEAVAASSGVANTQAPADPEGDGTGVVVSRRTQRLGLLAATGVVGVALGGLFGAVFAMVGGGVTTDGPWLASVKLGVAAWLAVAVLPSLKYPANPPGVGDPATVGSRSVWYLTAILLSVVTALAVWGLNGRLKHVGVSVAQRHLLAGAAAVAGVVLVAALPANSDPIRIPADLLWNFRLNAFATTATLWFTLVVVFGLLGVRGAHRGAR
ncbi:MAG: CbtA family protein [Nitriliruptorales bacterium]